ncbi:sulfotransferase family protein [Lyngbya aestuarii BL J]|uniref:Sulfotransferase family protein n=2 Tax=Lyngbya aestuarii BL J TaxID=1348334 RepID=U7QBC6_9CYAN|nr:sulfotransferase family 2 domain-containing protein [Lyngbya aestuarii]ERT04031.1 sulfotransferase family protein [Lyngbya aestuarii BL J]
MLISVKKKFIFIANTKAASTTVEFLLKDYAQIDLSDAHPGLKHMSYQNVIKNFDFFFKALSQRPKSPSCIQDFYKFGVFRDPVDWILSWFNFRSRKTIANPEHPNHSNYLGNIKFESFIDSLDQYKITPQSIYFIDKKGRNAMDFIIRYEDFSNQLSYVIDRLGIDLVDAEIPRKNISQNKRILPHQVSKQARKKIENFLQQDYDFMDSLKN